MKCIWKLIWKITVIRYTYILFKLKSLKFFGLYYYKYAACLKNLAWTFCIHIPIYMYIQYTFDEKIKFCQIFIIYWVVNFIDWNSTTQRMLKGYVSNI